MALALDKCSKKSEEQLKLFIEQVTAQSVALKKEQEELDKRQAEIEASLAAKRRQVKAANIVLSGGLNQEVAVLQHTVRHILMSFPCNGLSGATCDSCC